VGSGGLAAGQANARRRNARRCCFDESSLSLLPNVRRTWAAPGRRSVARRCYYQWQVYDGDTLLPEGHPARPAIHDADS
jgi:hypothetical protein